MRKRVPLNAIRAFEAVARHTSVSRAADELGVTPTAVSHQIRQLGDFLQVELFERRGNRLTLSAEAGANLQRITRALDLIDTSMRNLSAVPEDEARLVIGTSPSFASSWLMPRLGMFLEDNPGVELALNTFITRAEGESQKSDIRICNWECETDAQVLPLLDEESVPVCAPDLAAEFGNDPARLLREAPLIHVDRRQLGYEGGYPEWPCYLNEFGVERDEILHGPSFNQAAIAIDAAKAGVGLLLGRSLLIEPTLAQGSLVTVAEAYPERNRYYIHRARGTEDRKAMNVFCGWLRQAVKGCTAVHAL